MYSRRECCLSLTEHRAVTQSQSTPAQWFDGNGRWQRTSSSNARRDGCCDWHVNSALLLVKSPRGGQIGQGEDRLWFLGCGYWMAVSVTFNPCESPKIKTETYFLKNVGYQTVLVATGRYHMDLISSFL